MAANEIPSAGYSSQLLNRVQVADATAFYFEKPSHFDFKPGQSADRECSPILRRLTPRGTRALFRLPVPPLKTN